MPTEPEPYAFRDDSYVVRLTIRREWHPADGETEPPAIPPAELAAAIALMPSPSSEPAWIRNVQAYPVHSGWIVTVGPYPNAKTA